ncbi:MAG TPA: RNA 2',3'-cyclic phosphodiesterase, partial [Herpetosiphonaceae bacterium]
MGSETWRLFIGMALPAAHLALLVEAQRELAGRTKALRPLSPATLHLTLHFLGDVEAALVPALEQALAARFAGRTAPLLRLAGLGAFPDLRQPRAVWAGLAGEIEPLAALRELAQDAG